MTNYRPLPNTWTVVLLILGAMAVPRLLADSHQQALANSGDAVYASAAVGYARARLWDDFLSTRAASASEELPSVPALDEYQTYLESLGLTKTRDVVIMMVFPALHPDHLLDRIRVELVRTTGSAVHLTVTTLTGASPPRRAGTLFIEVGKDGLLSCRAEEHQESLWSYLPIIPQPILP